MTDTTVTPTFDREKEKASRRTADISPPFVATGNTVVAPLLPCPPDPREKVLYIQRGEWWLLPVSMVSFGCAVCSSLHFLAATPQLLWLAPYLTFTIVYFMISLTVNIHHNSFNLSRHRELVQRWATEANAASIDILLPTAGEDIAILANTWRAVRELQRTHTGPIAIFVLDDSARPEVQELARGFGFQYSVRENRGWFKKAGNLRHGYRLTEPLGHQFVAIFDADFCPCNDFLRELLPYFYDNARVGLVQSPQYFDVQPGQAWLQRGAGAVQEFFYRFSQVARDSHDAAICVGTNAIYRRAALDVTGGTALIEHSEDVHTGFNMRRHRWTLRYVPLILAKGLCPDSLESFFKQQYRWCMGSMSLLGSRKFWLTRMRLRQRLCYFTGFCYYIHTAITLFAAPVIPLVLLVVAPDDVNAANYLLLAPSIAYTFIIFPLWHKADYGGEAWTVKHIYSWAHLFALADVLRRRPMGWTPTGAIRHRKDSRYYVFRVAQVMIGFVPSLTWAILAGLHVVVWHQLVFLPLFCSGLFATYITGRVASYRQPQAPKERLSGGSSAISTPVAAATSTSAVIGLSKEAPEHA